MSGPSAQYQGNPALQQMMLAAAMREKGGLLPSMTPVGPPQIVTSEPVPVVPRDSPVQGAPLPDASTFTQQNANQSPSPQTALQPTTRLPVSPQQMGNAITALGGGAPRATAPGMQPVTVDGSKPLADFSGKLDGVSASLPTISPAHRNGIDWKQLAGIIGPALMAAGGHPELGMQFIESQQKARQDEADRQLEVSKLYAQQHGPREVGHSLIQQGDDGKYQTLFSEPEPFESYASAQGLKPGSPEYADAVKNYRLGSWSDDAVAAKTGLMGTRFGYQSDVQDDRLATSRRNTDVRVNASTANSIRTTGATTRGQDLSHQDRQRGQNMHAATARHGQDLTDSRVRGSAAYQGRGGRGNGGGASAVAVGPNGHQIVVRNGRWVDAQTGAPVQ